MRKRKKTEVSSNCNARIAEKINGSSFERGLIKVESACRVLMIAYRLYWLWGCVKPLIEQYLLSS